MFYIAVTFSSNSFIIVSPDNVGGSSWSSITGGVKRQEVVNLIHLATRVKKKCRSWGESQKGLTAETLPAHPRTKSNVIPAGVNYQSCRVHAHKLGVRGEGKGRKANKGEEICS